MSFLDALDARYRLILCDIWGCVHDGVNLYPGAADRLRRWRSEAQTVVLITNAPRTADAVERQLLRLGLPRDVWDGIATSGEAGIAALLALGKPVGFIGTREDRSILASRGVEFAEGEVVSDVACTGLFEHFDTPKEHRSILERLARAGATLHCLNPDRIVIHGGVAEPCAGALADIYQALGGRVAWYGKPHRAIYEHALRLAGDPPPGDVLAIGDGLQTDALGAARMGFDCVFVTGGINAGRPFPPDFAEQEGLGNWQPVAVVDSLR